VKQKAGNDGQRPKGDATYGFFPLWNPPSSLRRSKLTSRMHEVLVTHRPARRKRTGNTTTVLAGKGTLHRAKSRRALALCAPLWGSEFSDGRLRRDHEAGADVGLRPTSPRTNATDLLATTNEPEQRLHKKLDTTMSRGKLPSQLKY
jgi:hypothetical protein